MQEKMHLQPSAFLYAHYCALRCMPMPFALNCVLIV